MAAKIVTEAEEHGVNLGRLVRLVEHVDMYRQFGQLDNLLEQISGNGVLPRSAGQRR